MTAQPLWLASAALLFGAGGFGATWFTTRAMRKVEHIKNTTNENSVALDAFNALAQRQNDEIARKDRRIVELETLIKQLQRKGSR